MKLLQFVLLMGLLVGATGNSVFAQPGSGQPETGEGISFTKPVQPEKPAFFAELLLIQADWSQAKEAKEIETELRAVLQGVAVPEELLASLPASGPQILFAPEIASLYKPEQLEGLKAWLAAKGLLLKVEPLSEPKPVPTETKPGSAGTAPQPYFYTLLRKPEGFIDLPPLPQIASQPFISRRPELMWEIQARHDLSGVVILRTLAILEQIRGQEEVQGKEKLDTVVCEFDLPLGQAAILNAFPTKNEEGARKAAGRKGFVPVLVVKRFAPVESKAPADAKLFLPQRVEALKVGKNPSLFWQSDNGRRGTRAPSVPDRTGLGTGGSGGYPSGVGPMPTRKDEADSTTKVFRLQYANASSLAETLRQLYSQEKLNAGVDARTNSLILNGPEPLLQVIEALLIRLDEKADEKTISPKPPLRASSGDSSFPSYRSLEQDAGAAAKELRDMEHRRNTTDRGGPKEYQDRVFGKDEAQLKEMRERLRAKVAQAFETRQRALQAELAVLQNRLSDLSQNIEMRQRIADQIIDRRVADLLNPDFRWEANSAADNNRPAKTPPSVAAPQPSATNGEPGPLVPARPSVSSTSIDLGGGDSSGGSPPTISLGKPEELRKLLDDAEQARRVHEFEMSAWLVELRRTNPKATEEYLLKHYPQAWEQRADARRRLQLARDQLAAQIRLLELELQDAEAALYAAQEALMRASKLALTGHVSHTQELAAKQAVGQAQRRVDRARVLLELYSKIAPAEKKTPGTAPATPGDAASEGAGVAKVLWDRLGVRVEAVPAEKLAISPFRGALRIVELRPDSPAAKEMRVEDLLLGLAVWETVTPEIAEYALRNAKDEKAEADSEGRIKFHVVRKGQPYFGYVSL